MGNLLQMVQSAVITRPLLLTELDDQYRDPEGNPLVLHYRVNLSRRQNKRRYDLYTLLNEIEKENEKGELTKAHQKALTDRYNAWARVWRSWWSEVLMTDEAPPMRPLERLAAWLRGLFGKEQPPRPEKRHLTRREIDVLAQDDVFWNYVTTAVGHRISEYEAETVKKVFEPLTPASTEQAQKCQNCTNAPSSLATST